MVCPKLKRSQMLKWANGVPRSLNASCHKYSSCKAYTEQSYLSEGACVLCGRFERPRWGLSFWMSLNRESPCVKGKVWDTSQGAWLNPALAAVPSSGGPLWSSTVSGVSSHHFQEVTQDEKKQRSPRASQNSASLPFSFWIVSRFLLCDVAYSCLDSENEQTCKIA